MSFFPVSILDSLHSSRLSLSALLLWVSSILTTPILIHFVLEDCGWPRPAIGWYLGSSDSAMPACVAAKIAQSTYTVLLSYKAKFLQYSYITKFITLSLQFSFKKWCQTIEYRCRMGFSVVTLISCWIKSDPGS
jgi:hypothetical protein